MKYNHFSFSHQMDATHQIRIINFKGAVYDL